MRIYPKFENVEPFLTLRGKIPLLGRTILWAVLAFQGVSCGTISYYHQAAIGQWQIERNKKPIKELQQSDEIEDNLKQKFNVIQDIRQFAFWHLELPAEDAYDSYVALGRDHVVWNVTACPEFSMEPYRWWYPFLGKLKYRGYFSKKEAENYAESFRHKGYDVAVEGVVAYSTLGWFRDPVFDTFLNWSDRAIAELLFHELSHQKVFLTGKTEWNEAFAVVTARAAVREWLESNSRFDELEKYEEEIALEQAFIALILQTKKELEQIYAKFEEDDTDNLVNDKLVLERREKAKMKESVFDQLRHRFAAAKEDTPTLSIYDGWISRPLNNARLTSIDTYYQWVPMFESLQARYSNDWSGYFEAVKRLDEEQK